MGISSVFISSFPRFPPVGGKPGERADEREMERVFPSALSISPEGGKEGGKGGLCPRFPPYGGKGLEKVGPQRGKTGENGGKGNIDYFFFIKKL